MKALSSFIQLKTFVDYVVFAVFTALQSVLELIIKIIKLVYFFFFFFYHELLIFEIWYFWSNKFVILIFCFSNYLLVGKFDAVCLSALRSLRSKPPISWPTGYLILTFTLWPRYPTAGNRDTKGGMRAMPANL